MADTKIEWADKSWNIITGCDPISTGCQGCYARRMANRLRGRFGYPADDPFRVTFHPDRLDEPLAWKKPKRIFVCSMADIFHKDVKPEWIDSILEVIAATPRHTYLVLTKRPENIEEKIYGVTPECGCRELGGGDYLPNLWLGVTAENQEMADNRIPILLNTIAEKRFVSIEPMLGPINLSKYLHGEEENGTPFEGAPHVGGCIKWTPPLDQVIAGAETGPGARPADLEWFRSLRDQCQAAGVPFFFKRDSQGSNLLDGREWTEVPK